VPSDEGDDVGSNDKRDLYRGIDDGWTRAIELALTPLLMGFLGYLVDSWLGTLPGFTIVFVVLAVVGMTIKLYYAYDASMRAEEAGKPWARRPAP
jgi:F0F1-type ATP synthase assembly protein I